MNDILLPASNEDILPIGMLGNGRGTAKAMEIAAIRKNNIKGWQPFHYEKISATEFEVTGGIPAVIGGAKKWPEPHTTVIVSEEELAQQMVLEEGASIGSDSVREVPTEIAGRSAPPVFDEKLPGATGGTPKFLTVILRMPDDAAGHQRIAEMLALNKNFFGAVVMATAFQDDILVSKFLQKS